MQLNLFQGLAVPARSTDRRARKSIQRSDFGIALPNDDLVEINPIDPKSEALFMRLGLALDEFSKSNWSHRSASLQPVPKDSTSRNREIGQ